VGYIDFQKAFDVVCHRKAFGKLFNHGICGTVLLWLKNFFSDRTHQTRVDTSLSDVAQLLSGVVQGSGIGPLMFLLYINELIDIIKSHGINVKVFADDVKLYLKIISDVNFVQFQAALDSLYSWANIWQLPISVDKCYALNIGTVVLNASLSINDSILPIASSVRDLGITVTNNLSPSVHISDIVSRAHKRALAIHRCFVSCDVSILLRAYKVYVRSLVQHNSIIWSPSTLSDIDSLESVQRRFTKRLSGLHCLSYEARLKRLKLQSLELRRLLADLMWCYKIIFGLVDIDVNQFFTHNSVPQTRGHRYKVLNHTVLEYVALSFVKDLSMFGTTYLWILILVP